MIARFSTRASIPVIRASLSLLLAMLAACGGGNGGEETRGEARLLQLTFDGENCTYEGPTALTPGPVELIFRNESKELACVNFVRHTGDETIQDAIDYIGEEPCTVHRPGWVVTLGTERFVSTGKSARWKGNLIPGIYHMVCLHVSPLRVWFGTGLTVED